MKSILSLFILSLACLLYGCQEKEEESPDLESLVQLESDEKDKDWEFESHDPKSLVHDNEVFKQEIIIEEKPSSPIIQESPESLR